MGHAKRAEPSQVRQRADPALTPAQPARAVAKHVLDRGGDSSNGMAAARPRGREQNQAGMHPALRQPLSRKRAEVPDVVVTQAHERSGSGPTRCPPSLQDSGVARGRLSGGSRRGGLAIAGAEAGDGGDTGAEEHQRGEGGGAGGGGEGGARPQAGRLAGGVSAAG